MDPTKSTKLKSERRGQNLNSNSDIIHSLTILQPYYEVRSEK